MLSAPAGPRGPRATRPRRLPQARAGAQPGGQAEQLGECSPWGVGGVCVGVPRPAGGPTGIALGYSMGGGDGFSPGQAWDGVAAGLEGGQVAPTP